MKEKILRVFLAGLVASLFVACGNDGANESAESSANSTTKSTDSVESKNAESTPISQDNKTIPNETSTEITQDVPQSQTTAGSEAINTEVAQKSPDILYKKCIACHGVKGEKAAPGSVGKVFIAQLPKEQIIEDLKGYRAKTLNKGGAAATMYLQAISLSDDDIKILAEYITTLK